MTGLSRPAHALLVVLPKPESQSSESYSELPSGPWTYLRAGHTTPQPFKFPIHGLSSLYSGICHSDDLPNRNVRVAFQWGPCQTNIMILRISEGFIHPNNSPFAP